ncbi:hypothetical protein ACFV3R_27685 [Streptomyces sp. NPDC059740]|uniref:hypothetical protein n=1 Tax=Streptomyces sp. NPDC059740 TaxID=3346926 RepID=UPI00365819C2
MSAWDWLDPRAVAAWREFDGGEAVAADRRAFQERLSRPGWVHTYPPQVLTESAVGTTTSVALQLSALICDFPRRVFGDDLTGWAHWLGLPEADVELTTEALRRPHLAGIATAFQRPDMVVTDEGLKLVELNVAASLGGLSTCAPYAAAAADSAYAGHLAARGLQMHATDTSRVWLEVFGRLVRRRPADGAPVRVFEATANPADTAGGRRFFADMVRSAGYAFSGGLVHDLELTDDGAFFEGERVHAVFTGYTWHEAKRFVPPALTRRLVELDTAGKVDFVGSPAAALHDNKANLALLFDPAHAGLLDARERDLVERYVPETFTLAPGTEERALDGRADLLCKPASAYGGKDIVFGCVLSDQEWAAELRKRLADPTERYVVQRRVRPARVVLPGLDPAEREMVLAPLVFGGEVAGIFVRHAPPRPDSTINTSSGAEAAGALTLR